MRWTERSNPIWKKFCNLVNAGPFLALDLLRTSHHWLLTWKKIGPGGGLNIAFQRAEINVSVHSCISTKSHRNKLKVWRNWWDMIGKQSGSVWLDIQNSIQWPSAFEGAGASALPSTSSAYMWNLLHVFHVDSLHAALNPGHPQHLSWYIHIYSIVLSLCVLL